MRNIKFKGSLLTLAGRPLRENIKASDFRVINTELAEVHLSDYGNKIKIITSFPSLDTPVCDLQLKEFNKQATHLSSDIIILGISKDLPFAQKRFCDANQIKNVLVLSDYRFSSFGINYGLLIKELNLLARSVIILDKNNFIRYYEIVEELTTQPNYNQALLKIEEVIKIPALYIKEELSNHCRPCEVGGKPLESQEIAKLLVNHKDWQLVEGRKITREFKFKDFIEAKYFLDLVSVVSQEQGHHPAITIIYNKLKITLTTHALGGLSENDFIMAKIIDELEG
ncbi:MAG: thiol peroxidase [Candidatus Omnitrophota bacterium]